MIHSACVVTDAEQVERVIESCVEALCIDQNPMDRERLHELGSARNDRPLFEYMAEHEANDPACVALVQYGPYTDERGLIHARAAYIVVALEESIKEGEDGVGAPGLAWEQTRGDNV